MRQEFFLDVNIGEEFHAFIDAKVNYFDIADGEDSSCAGTHRYEYFSNSDFGDSVF